MNNFLMFLILLTFTINANSNSKDQKYAKQGAKSALKNFFSWVAEIPGIDYINASVRNNEYKIISIKQKTGTLRLPDINKTESVSIIPIYSKHQRSFIRDNGEIVHPGFVVTDNAELPSGRYRIHATGKNVDLHRKRQINPRPSV
ncbi:hypothetical protein [Endozoicomonas atrinae]|uniref:hypothetical protein n=1 Tax=Endozoicomonas atrinae TaxID=1333660 RepID=UPI000825C672|nr:hypothetical protein [Endozoicomonas atrinae]